MGSIVCPTHSRGGANDLDDIPTIVNRYRCSDTAVRRWSTPLHAQRYVEGERPQQRGYSLAVVTEGGKTVWLGGQIATVDDSGKSLAGDFDGQVRQIFKLIDATLRRREETSRTWFR
jgi:enamine deaminase RidA (YjgF/YER057c/UK114 family)